MQEKNESGINETTKTIAEIKRQIAKVIVGQDRVIEEILIGLLCGGHVLLVGVPGLAKTLIVRTIAETMDLEFSRIQFTPDLMPMDITGTDILDEGGKGSGFRFLKGPIFANVVLADEINRTPPKTQAALLQSMQELQVTTGGKTYPIDPPFFVLATQNPIEQEGTYPLPEAQLDRFMLEILVDYPSPEEEIRIVKETTAGPENSDTLRAFRDRLPSNVPICVGERHYTRHGFRPVLENHLCDVIMPDITRCGGPSEMKRIATMAETYGTPIAPHNPNGPLSTLASAHVCASIPNFFRCEFMFNDVAWRDEVITHPLDVRDGHLHLSKRPGLGVDLIEEELEKHPGIRGMDERKNFYV